jgi:hypothetical protein
MKDDPWEILANLFVDVQIGLYAFIFFKDFTSKHQEI